MTTYYGVWSGEEWWYEEKRPSEWSIGGEIFRVETMGLAKAQTAAVNRMWETHGWGEPWEARAIGEDGLPVKEGDGTVVDLLVDAENRLCELPSVEEAHVIVEFILHRTACLLSPPQFAEYVQGVKSIAKTITEMLGTDRGVSLIGTIGETHAVDIMREG